MGELNQEPPKEVNLDELIESSEAVAEIKVARMRDRYTGDVKSLGQLTSEAALGTVASNKTSNSYWRRNIVDI